jgi:hypothetical protein
MGRRHVRLRSRSAAVALLALALALASCGDENLAGSYAGTTTGSYYRLKDGQLGRPSVPFTIPNDTLDVKVVGRAYQHRRYAVTVRGCTVPGESDDTNSLQLVPQSGRCTFDIPSLGPVGVSLMGGILREKGGVYLSMSGNSSEGSEDGTVRLTYETHAKPK